MIPCLDVKCVWPMPQVSVYWHNENYTIKRTLNKSLLHLVCVESGETGRVGAHIGIVKFVLLSVVVVGS